MIDVLLAVIPAAAFYLIGRMHGHDAAMREESRLAESVRQEIVELRKWKADHVGKEKA